MLQNETASSGNPGAARGYDGARAGRRSGGGAEDDLAGDQAEHGADVGDTRLGAREDVVREHDEVGLLAGLERAQLGLLARGVGVPGGERADSLLARHPL